MSKMADNSWGNICERVDTCALTGAAAFVAGIPGAEVLANGPLWCYFYALRYLEHVEYSIAERFHGSQPDNNAVVYGSEKCLLETLQRLLARKRHPELLLIESSCSMSLIGDDLNGIARKAQLPFPFVTMDCGGMLGGFAEGYAKAGIKILEAVADGNVSAEENRVNILGMTPYYLNGAADCEEICRLLRLSGCRIQAAVGCGSGMKELRQAGKAALNIVTNEELGLPLAEYLEKRFGTPYVLAGLPYGVEGTVKWLERIGSALPALKLETVRNEAEALQSYLTSWINETHSLWGSLWFDRAVVSAPPTAALCLAQALRSEWADMGNLTVLCQRQLPKSAPAAYCDAADAVYTAGVEQDKMSACFADDGQSLLLLGSSSEGSLLYRQKHSHFLSCNIAFPANDEIFLLPQPFAGLNGSRYMLQRLWNGYIGKRLQEIR